MSSDEGIETVVEPVFEMESASTIPESGWMSLLVWSLIVTVLKGTMLVRVMHLVGKSCAVHLPSLCVTPCEVDGPTCSDIVCTRAFGNKKVVGSALSDNSCSAERKKDC